MRQLALIILITMNSSILPNVVYDECGALLYCDAGCHNAESFYAGCYHAESHYAVCRYTEYRSAEYSRGL